eukprot:TRINITY_DN2334_c0_g1_i1.p1 TRINITY_DN2334_c0_g1~~TRINITY_DN2334_c0_g1_i1.p1  ORF type:complete len:200 (+),score=29.20 TRINITY_DN2334_c0_g1_i1:533-1132(+)
MNQRGKQNLSVTCVSITTFLWTGIYIILLLTLFGVFNMLNFIYFLSYVKLFVTFVKYVPQAYLNFKRKSTVGWHIWNVTLDLNGGIFSFIQMGIDAIDAQSWSVIFGNPSKIGLSLFSIGFDLLFIVQHYILYKDNNDWTKTDSDKEELSDNEEFDYFDDDDDSTPFYKNQTDDITNKDNRYTKTLSNRIIINDESKLK